MLADVCGNQLAMMRRGIGEDVLDQVIPKLIPSDCNHIVRIDIIPHAINITLTVDQRHAGPIRSSLADTGQVSIKEIGSSNLEALFNHFRSVLINAILGRIADNVVNGATLVAGQPILADVLDTPIPKLTSCNNIDVGQHFIDTRPLVLFHAVFKNILDNEAARLTQGDLMPHPLEGFIDMLHDIWGRVAPVELKKLLPDMTGIPVNNRVWNAAQKLVDKTRLEILRYAIQSLLDDMASKGIHTQSNRVSTDIVSNVVNLLHRSMLKTTLDEEVSESIDHERIALLQNCFHDFIFLRSGSNLELLLQKDGRLLVVVRDNLINNVVPITVCVLFKKTAIV